MHMGMLWFDNSQTKLEIKVQKAAEYFQRKHGKTPDLVLVHPSMMPEFDNRHKSIEVNGLTVRPYRPVLPGHIWIGIADEGEK